MMLSLKISCILSLPLLFFDFINYFSIREMLWSIVWCDKGGKYNSLRELKNGRTVRQKITMLYLMPHVKKHYNEFLFWYRVKKIFVVSQVVLLILYFVFAFIKTSYLYEVIMFLIILQSGIIFIIFRLQRDANRSTKYDRIRMGKRRR